MSEPGSNEARSGDTGRLETFADGVMAIAITLLILEVRVPHVEARGLGAALARQWPSYAGFVVSFLTIGIIWVNHHHMFKLIARSTHAFLMLNVVFLMTICVLLWPTALVSDYVSCRDGRTASTAVYRVVTETCGIMVSVVFRIIGANDR